MATIQNERDLTLQAAPQRLLPVPLPPHWTVAPEQMPGLGDLALQDQVNLTTQVIGALAVGSVTGLGALALLNQVNLGTQTNGSLDALTQVTNLGDLAYANQVAANEIGAGTLAAGVVYAGVVNASQVNSWGLSIYTPTGQLVLDASRRLNRSDLTDLGVLAALNSLALGAPELTGFGTLAGLNTVSTSQVTGLGALATQNAVNLATQVTGALANSNVSGLGALALLNTVSLNTQVTGTLNGATQVTNLGTLAYANGIAANQIGAGTLAAGVIYSGSISANNITSGTMTGRTVRTSSTNTRVEMASATNTLDVYISGTQYIKIGGSTGNGYISIDKGTGATPGIYVSSASGAAGIFSTISGGSTSAISGNSSGTATAVNASSSGTGVAIFARGTSTASSTNHAIRAGSARGTGSSGIVGAATGHAFVAELGTISPFTGSHDGLVPNGFVGEPGDILIDDQLVRSRSVADAILTAYLSSEVNEVGAIGVLDSIIGPLSGYKPPALISGVDPETGMPYMSAEWVAYGDTHTAVIINSVGEGLINVCGRNGNLQKGDLVVCSDMPGKGQRQADDIIRSNTVAKVRVAATFDYPDQVKLVPCIYLCG